MSLIWLDKNALGWELETLTYLPDEEEKRGLGWATS